MADWVNVSRVSPGTYTVAFTAAGAAVVQREMAIKEVTDLQAVAWMITSRVTEASARQREEDAAARQVAYEAASPAVRAQVDALLGSG